MNTRRQTGWALVGAITLASASLAAQRYVKWDGKIDYTLVVENQSREAVNQWWLPFLEKNSRTGYCFDLPTIPLVDRPEIGDKAVVLKVGGNGQLVQVIEIPPGGKTKWHGYGWEGEALFYVLTGAGQTEYRSPGGLPTNKYTWKRNSLFAIATDHQMQHTNTGKEPVRLLSVTGFAINLYPYVAEELRSGRQNPAEGPEERAATLMRTTYPGHFVEDLREHPVAMREARGNKTAFFNAMATVGHRTHPNIHISELTGPEAFAHKHGNQPMFVILKGGGYDIWSEAANLKEYEAAVKNKTAHSSPYQVGTLCGVPAGPHWHQHFSTASEPLRYLAIVPRGQYEDKSTSQQ